MILYNMRERGPFEYDKFVLNVFNIYNTIMLEENTEFKTNSKEYQNLLNIKETLDTYFNKFTGDDNYSDILESKLLKINKR
ncbi:MAG: hypothetical protein SPI06_07280 [Terrisporobacter sp.]|uniref:hypothetical protein n=1 Tax=Terrisporobacter sp. TaxID=1965305 RepID=UPI002A911422|nr:hypothetical protein [Terrisporobacter sp.]MDY6153197.1 hypothetical protein [Terrisporobacter sp.]